MPDASTEAMQSLLQELSNNLPPDRHAVLVMDCAGWNTAHRMVWPANISPLRPPPYSPQLNPIERVWLHLRERQLSHRRFDSYNVVLNACCAAWNALLADIGRLASLGGRA